MNDPVAFIRTWFFPGNNEKIIRIAEKQKVPQA